MQHFLRTLRLFAAVVCCCFFGATGSQLLAADKPIIIIFLTDDLGYTDISVTDSPVNGTSATTPELMSGS